MPPGRSSRAHSASTPTSSSTCSRISPATHHVGAAVGQRHRQDRRRAPRARRARAASSQAASRFRSTPTCRYPRRGDVRGHQPAAAGEVDQHRVRARCRRDVLGPRRGQPVQHREVPVRAPTTGRPARRTAPGRCAPACPRSWRCDHPPAAGRGHRAMIAGVRRPLHPEVPVSVTVVGSLNEDVLVARRPAARAGRDGHRPGGRARARREGRQPGRRRRACWAPGVHMVGRVGEDPAGDRQLAALADSRVNVGRVHRTPGVPDRLGHDPGGGRHRREPDRGRARRERRAHPRGRRRRVGAAGAGAAAPARGAAGHRAWRRRGRRPAPSSSPRRRRSRCRPSCSTGSTCWCPTSTSSRSWPARRPASGPPAELVGAGPLGGLRARSWSPSAPAARWWCRPTAARRVLQAPPPVTPVDTTGAGDCFCGALGAGAGPRREPDRGGAVRGGRGGAVHHRAGRPRGAAGRRRRPGAAPAGAGRRRPA